MAGETGEIIYPSKVYIAMFFSLVVKLCVCSVQFSRSVVSNSVTPWTAGLPVHHQLPESTQTYVHLGGDAIWPSHPLWLIQ